jgi:hypothetical protein
MLISSTPTSSVKNSSVTDADAIGITCSSSALDALFLRYGPLSYPSNSFYRPWIFQRGPIADFLPEARGVTLAVRVFGNDSTK